jgi:hypothetical protein
VEPLVDPLLLVPLLDPLVLAPLDAPELDPLLLDPLPDPLVLVPLLPDPLVEPLVLAPLDAPEPEPPLLVPPSSDPFWSLDPHRATTRTRPTNDATRSIDCIFMKAHLSEVHRVEATWKAANVPRRAGNAHRSHRISNSLDCDRRRTGRRYARVGANHQLDARRSALRHERPQVCSDGAHPVTPLGRLAPSCAAHRPMTGA